MDEEIREIMGDAMNLFRDKQVSQFLKVACQKGFLRQMSDHMNRVYCHTNEISDIRIIESLLSVALYHCNNNYCFIVHSSVLLEHGFRVSDVQELMDLFELPDDIPESYKWSSIVRLTYFSFKDRVLMPDNFRKIRRFLSEEENSDFSVIMAYANFLFFMLYTFYDEIQITNEMLLQDPQTGKFRKEVQDLVSYYETMKCIRGIDEAEGRTPVFTICSYCKDLKDKEGGWHPIEQTLEILPANSAFSHGICNKCFDRTIYVMNLELSIH